MTQDTLYKRIRDHKSLTEKEQASALALLGARCQQRTKDRLKSVLRFPQGTPLVGILEGVMIHPDETVSYCAGQSYPDEIRIVRNHLTGRK